MPSRGPYYVDKDTWVAQPVGSSAGYGNGAGTEVMFGPVPAAVTGDPDYKSRGMFEIAAADMAAFLASLTSVDTAYIDHYAADNTCIGSKGAHTRLLLEVMTTDFSSNGKTGCALSSTTAADGRWDQSNNITTTNRAFFSGESLAANAQMRFDVTAIMEARRAAGDTSALRYRIISANTDGSGYDETSTSRRMSSWSSEYATDATKRPQLSGTGTIGNIPKSLPDTAAATDGFSVTQTGTSPRVDDTAVGTDSFTVSATGTWTTVLDADGNGLANLIIPAGGVDNVALIPTLEGDIALRCMVQLDKIPLAGTASFMLYARATNKNNGYRARISMGGNTHDISIILEKIVAGVVTTLQYITNIRTFVTQTGFWLKLQVADNGAGATTLNAKVWRNGENEPGWMLNIDDSEAALQANGYTGMGGRVGTTVTNMPITFQMDQFEGFAP